MVTLVAAIAAAFFSPGCRPKDTLIVATPWPIELRRELELSFRSEEVVPITIGWIVLTPDEAIAGPIDRTDGVDVLLGGSLEQHERLGRAGRLVPIEPGGDLSWQVGHRTRKSTKTTATSPNLVADSALDDPRIDPASLARAVAMIADLGWPNGYETLVRQAGRSRTRPDGRSPGPKPEVGGLSIPRDGRNPDEARKFVRFLKRRGLLEPIGPGLIVEETARSLMADLLGAALVDARPELRDADRSLERFGHPTQAESAIGERPPWPPASVSKLQADPNGPALIETLLAQVAPDPEARAWLAASWSSPRRVVDGELLDELAKAAGGRLALEPRFRSWLRGEWTAWTRQLYRRVARVAGGYIPS